MCTSPPVVKNGYVSFESLATGSTWTNNAEVVYKCFTYYGLVDSDRLTCMSASFAGTTPKCEYHQKTEIVFWLVLVLLLLLLLAILGILIFLCCYFCKCCKRHGKGGKRRKRKDEESGARRKDYHGSADSKRRKRDDTPPRSNYKGDEGDSCCAGCCGTSKEKTKGNNRNRSKSPRPGRSKSPDSRTHDNRTSGGCCAGCCGSDKDKVTTRGRSRSRKVRPDSSFKEGNDDRSSGGCCQSCCGPREKNKRRLNREESQRDTSSRKRSESNSSIKRKQGFKNEDSDEVTSNCCGCCSKSKPRKKQLDESFSEEYDEIKPAEEKMKDEELLTSDIKQQPIQAARSKKASEAKSGQPVDYVAPVVYQSFSKYPDEKLVEEEMENLKVQDKELEKRKEHERLRKEEIEREEKRQRELKHEMYAFEQQQKEREEELKRLQKREDKKLDEEQKRRQKEFKNDRQKENKLIRREVPEKPSFDGTNVEQGPYTSEREKHLNVQDKELEKRKEKEHLRKEEVEREAKRQRELEDEMYAFEQQQKEREEELNRLQAKEDKKLNEKQRRRQKEFKNDRQKENEPIRRKVQEKPLFDGTNVEQGPYTREREKHLQVQDKELEKRKEQEHLRKEEKEREEKRQRELEDEMYPFEQQQNEREEELKKLQAKEDKKLGEEQRQRQKELKNDGQKENELIRREVPEKPFFDGTNVEQGPCRSERENYFTRNNDKYPENKSPSKTSNLKRKNPITKSTMELMNSNEKYVKGIMNEGIGKKGMRNPKVYKTVNPGSSSARDDYLKRDEDSPGRIKSHQEDKLDKHGDEKQSKDKRVKLINSNDKYVRGIVNDSIGKKGTNNPLVYRPYKIKNPVFTDRL